MTDRTPQDAAIKRAEYMATAAEHLLSEIPKFIVYHDEAGNIRNTDDLCFAAESVSESAIKLRSAVNEFRKCRAYDKYMEASQEIQGGEYASAQAEVTDEQIETLACEHGIINIIGDYPNYDAKVIKFARALLSAKPAVPAVADEDEWTRMLKLSEEPSIHEMLENFSHDSTDDNAVCLVREIARKAIAAQPAGTAKPVAWIRWCTDGGYEGPIMDCDRRMDDVRRSSGVWTPLYTAAPSVEADARDAEIGRFLMSRATTNSRNAWPHIHTIQWSGYATTNEGNGYRSWTLREALQDAIAAQSKEQK